MEMGKMYTQNTFEMNGHHAWLYLLDTPLGHIWAVQYENNAMSLETPFLKLADLDEAKKKFKSVCRMMVKKYCRFRRNKLS